MQWSNCAGISDDKYTASKTAWKRHRTLLQRSRCRARIHGVFHTGINYINNYGLLSIVRTQAGVWLALESHPNTGDSIEVTQQIKVEFERLYEIWRTTLLDQKAPSGLDCRSKQSNEIMPPRKVTHKATSKHWAPPILGSPSTARIWQLTKSPTDILWAISPFKHQGCTAANW